MSDEKIPDDWPLKMVIEELAPQDLVHRLREAENQVKAATAIVARSARANWITGSTSVLYEQEDDHNRLAGSVEHRDRLLAQVLVPFRAKLVVEEWKADARFDDPEADRSPIVAAAWPYIEITDWANSKGIRTQGRGRAYFDIRISQAGIVIAPEEPQSLRERERLFTEYLIGEKRAGRQQPRTVFEQSARQKYHLMKKTFDAIWAVHGWHDPGRIAEKTPPENPL